MAESTDILFAMWTNESSQFAWWQQLWNLAESLVFVLVLKLILTWCSTLLLGEDPCFAWTVVVSGRGMGEMSSTCLLLFDLLKQLSGQLGTKS